MRLSVTVTTLPPPHATMSDRIGRVHFSSVDSGDAEQQIGKVIRGAIELGVFDANGCLNIVVQHAALETSV